MPYIELSSYRATPFFQFNKHLQTIIPSFRQVKGISYQRERITTPDNDFLDLDWLDNEGEELVILTHGLEGNSTRPYMLGMAKLLSQHNFDILAWNCRSCSGEMNKAFRFYNHGDIEDIRLVVETALKRKKYKAINLIGFSMGGNISLKYAAVSQNPILKTVISYSAPLDMKTSIAVLEYPSNWLYKHKFIKGLMPKLAEKCRMYPEKLSETVLKKTKEWYAMLETYFCIFNGYASLDDFFEKGSALNFIPQLKIPALIIQAQNDPMLTRECMPIDLAKQHDYIHLELPKLGGHCGFMLPDNAVSWSEMRALDWLKAI